MVGYAFAALHRDRVTCFVPIDAPLPGVGPWERFSRTRCSGISASAEFAAFDQDAIDNKSFLAAGKLEMPVLALGGEKSFGLTMAAIMRFAATNVEEDVVPDSGHWIMEENPTATIALVRAFLDKKQ